MRFTAHWIRSLARLVLAALLLAQGIQFAQACVMNAHRPALAFAAGDHCNVPGKQAPIVPNACLNQCLQADQSSAAHHVGIPGAPDVVVFVLPVECVQSSVLGVVTRTQFIGDSSPPPALRFCSLQL